MARLRPPAVYVIFNVTFRIARPCSNYQTGAPFPVPAAPLHVSIVHHHPLAYFPDSKRSRCFLLRFRPVFSYLPVGVTVLRCAAARLGCLQSLPVQPDYHACVVTIS